MKLKSYYKLLGSIAMFMLLTPVMAQEAAQALPPTDYFSLSTDTLLMVFAIFLLLPIYYLTRLIFFGVKINIEKKSKTLGVIAILMMSYTFVQAQADTTAVAATAAATTTSFNYVTYTLLIVILIELLAIGILSYNVTKLLNSFSSTTSSTGEAAHQEGPGLFAVIWQKLNSLRPMEDEKDIMIDHNYDGIRELDNVSPPWFTAGFIGTIIFACIYLWVYHVSKSAPNQIEEYTKAVTIADAQHEEFLKTQANLVDENTVTLLTDANSIGEGKKVFDANCVACHRNDGGGAVGPNLTDDYWIHGGSVHDIFKTIKYGVLDKGMVPWQDNLTPTQIAEVVAYIHTLKGTNPPNPKAQEGELYQEGAVADNAAAAPTEAAVN